MQGIAGDSVVLECEPPRGHPEPQIRWKKNGQALELDLDLGVDSDRYLFPPHHHHQVVVVAKQIFFPFPLYFWLAADDDISRQDPSGGER